MPKLVRNGELTDHDWVVLRTEDECTERAIKQSNALVPFNLYESLSTQYPQATLGFWLAPNVDVEQVKTALVNASVIAIDFESFMDGRGFSLARTLREHADYEGEIRAIGHFIPDQMAYLHRCGFNSFEFSDDTQIEAIDTFLNVFSESYQAGSDEPQPLFRRRA